MMETMDNPSLDNLLNLEKNFRKTNQSQNCLQVCLQIIKLLLNSSSNIQYSHISKILLHKDQSLFVIFGMFKEIFNYKNNFMNNQDSTILYFDLLHQVLKKSNDYDTNYTDNKKSILQMFQTSDKNYSQIEAEINKINITFDSNVSCTNFDNSGILNSKNNFLVMTNQGLLGNSANSYENNNTTSNQPPSPRKNSDEPCHILSHSSSKELVPKKFEKKNYKINSSLPFMLISINATLNSKQILDLLGNIFEGFKFKMIYCFQKNELEIMYVYEKIPSKIYNFFCCKKKQITQLSVTILLHDKVNTKNENKYERKIFIRSIQGEETSIEKTIINFLKKIIKHLTKLQILRKSKIFNEYNFDVFIQTYFKKKNIALYKGKAVEYNDISMSYSLNSKEEQFEKSLIDLSQDEAVKVFDIYKILSRENYSLGKSLSEFLVNFKEKYKNHFNLPANEINTKQIMTEITEEIGECLQTFSNSFNSNSLNNNNEKENIRQAIEQYIFNKLYYLLIEIYQKKYEEDDMNFSQSQQKIKSTMTVDQLFTFLEIKKKFRGNEKYPFIITIELLNKLEYEHSPKKKFEVLTQANLEIRNSILDISKGKFELDSMDDELPIIIYIATQINTKNFVSELNFIDDYLKCTLKDELFQNKMITNLLSATRYISYSWEEK